MMRRRVLPPALACWALLASCAVTPTPPPTPGQPTDVPRPQQAPEGTAQHGFSELTVRWDSGPCDPNDARSCHQSARFTPDAQVLTIEVPNSGLSPTPKTRTSALAAGELDAIRSVVDGRFEAQMKAGFPCAGAADDASIVIALRVADGPELTQNVTGCVRDPAAPPNSAQALVTIAERYRFVR